MSTTNYNSFYNINKTRFSARYPFLPKKQIERKIKHLWEKASVERRETLCLSSSGTIPKSPFKGSILLGLCKKKVSVDQFSNGSPHILNSSPASVEDNGHAHTLRSSIKIQHPKEEGERVLRSSTKKLVSTRRVSFNLEHPSPSRPNTRCFNQEQNPVKKKTEKTKEEKLQKEKSKRKQSKKSVDSSQGPLKKRKLSLEEEKLYEFEDDRTKPIAGKMTKLKTGAGKHVFKPEEYNLESITNSGMFSDDSQSPVITSAQRSPETTQRRRLGDSVRQLQNGKQTCANKDTRQDGSLRMKVGTEQAVRKWNGSNDCRKGRKGVVPTATVSVDTSQSDVDNTEEVPWMVSACPDNSSDDIPDDSYDDEEEAVYDYYHKSSSESSAPTLPSLSQESEDIVNNLDQNDSTFSWNGVCFTKKSNNIVTDMFDSQVSFASMDATEVMSISSTEVSMSVSSSPSERQFLGQGKLMTSSPQWSLPSPDNREEPLLPRRKMRLKDEAAVESPVGSRCGRGADVSHPADAIEAPVSSPDSRKKKMRDRGGEEVVSVNTAVQNTTQDYDQGLVSSKKHAAPMGSSMMSSNQRNVLKESNSRYSKPTPVTGKTRREKEDLKPMMERRRSGRLRYREGLMNGSQTEEESGSLTSRDSKKSPQHNGCAEDITEREIMSPLVERRDEAFHSDGILCDLFQPSKCSHIRSFNPPVETEFYHQNLLDPVSSHLFLEENYFL